MHVVANLDTPEIGHERRTVTRPRALADDVAGREPPGAKHPRRGALCTPCEQVPQRGRSSAHQ
ncbi:MAG: hypothetical protein ACLQVI_33930 [Polyangiaceae bacterium]